MQKKKTENRMFIGKFEKVLHISENIGHVLVQGYVHALERPEKTPLSTFG